MRIRILSDLHLEFGDFHPPEVPCDCVILAGDVHTKRNARAWIAEHFRSTPVIYVLGNHEYYGEQIPALVTQLKSDFSGTNVHVLENEPLSLNGVEFFGTTLWTDMKLLGDPITGAANAGDMTDFKRIRLSSTYRKFRPVDARRFHAESRSGIERFLKSEPARQVVVTHHAPSACSLPERLRTEPSSCGYASNLEDMITSRGPALWVHGHIHSSSNYRIGRTRVVANPRGYPDELNAAFVPDLVVEV